MTALIIALTIASTAMTIPDNPCPSGWQYILAEVRPGESRLSTMAQRLRVTPAELASWNDRPVSSLLNPGELMVFCRDQRPASIGYPWRGRLRGGVNMDADGDGRGCGWTMSPTRTHTWGTPETIAMLSDCLCRYKTRFPGAPNISLGDISRQNGRRLSRHISHQSGRDVDLGYITNPPQTAGYFNSRARYGNMDVEKQWWLLKCFIDKGSLQYAFMNGAAISSMKAYVTSTPEFAGYLRYFPGGTSPVISLDRDHWNHIHLRFVCPRGDGECMDR